MTHATTKNFIYYCRYFIITFFFLFIFLTISSLPTYAQTITQFDIPNLNPDVPQDQHTFTQSAMIETISSAICLITDMDLLNPKQGCLNLDPQTHKLSLNSDKNKTSQIGGLIGFLPKIFGAVYAQPATTSEYVRYLASNFGIVKPANAQNNTNDNGFIMLKPIQELWKASRNIAYLFFVIIFVIIGLAIILRVRIDPRTVMSIDNQIPRIIIGIILITFSYGIAGFLIDTMWLVTYTGINVVTSAVPNITNPSATDCGTEYDKLQQRAERGLLLNPISYGSSIFQQSCQADDKNPVVSFTNKYMPSLTGLVKKISSNMFLNNGIVQMTLIMDGAVGSTLQDFISQLLFSNTTPECSGLLDIPCQLGKLFSTGMNYLSQILLFFIIMLILAFNFIRIWFELLRSYVMVIFYVIVGPFWILMGLLPGKPLGFEKWLRSLTACLATFPATAICLCAAAIFAHMFAANGTNENNMIILPLIGNPNVNGFGSLIAFAIILMTPALQTAIRQSLKVPGSKIPNAAIVAGARAGTAVPQKIGAGVKSRVWGVDDVGLRPLSQITSNWAGGTAAFAARRLGKNEEEITNWEKKGRNVWQTITNSRTSPTAPPPRKSK